MLRTKSQRNTLCRKCPVARVADTFGDPCALLIMHNLLGAPRRFGELEDLLGGISPRTLTKTLRRLEAKGFITRTHFKKPMRFHYELTSKGKAFQNVVAAMRAYGKAHL
ncbi:transcriptional regulator [Candidatus Kaiserbacteria bacterium CG10_big_fil_rev_8_21_14_0_10_59_10]|uniref:Transcriptional regulator n=1 Tax=Candidatus Kaiserbacteria bacterium CG10_big_fil_rev_8_21_14_0_10_59_10 TaxID=1974612 RepID=A0A2H0U803_9BACT|nr:MAG: transcriptional regulator [Candidatus Kaiserbacteria bacterium CG10_big_fil_rev_8_21_14_0_10_59_10]